MDYMLALDQGTTSSRAVLFDRAGQVVALAQQEFAQIFPQPGWVEHDPADIWRSQRDTARQVLRQVAQQPGGATVRIAGLGISNQRETTLLWDRKTGVPVANAIVWQDRRTAVQCDALRARGLADMIQQKTGLVLDAYFSATKLQWLLDHVPGARARAQAGELAFGTVDSWLIWNLTGGADEVSRAHALHVTDTSNASRTLMFNLHTLQWDDELLALFDIPRSVLPEVRASSGVLGYSRASVLGSAIAIAGVAGDQQAATFGQACFAPGMAKNTYGTGCFMLMNVGAAAVPSRHRLLSTVAWSGPDGVGAPTERRDPRATCYALEGSVFMGGATVQWLRDGLQIISHANEVEALAASVADTGDVFLVPAFAGLGAPHWDGFARGTLVGMTRGTNRAHIARAALKSIALQVADVFDAMASDSGIALQELRVDGGACRNNLLMQMQANLLGVPVVRPRVTETSALGAACLAGLATGFWRDAGEISAQWVEDARFVPLMSEDARLSMLARWRQAVQRSRAWVDN
jgi:glycerol kinase